MHQKDLSHDTKNHFLDIWINGDEWLNSFEKLRHCIDMYSIKSSDVNFSGQPDYYIDFIQNTELSVLVKKQLFNIQVEKFSRAIV